MKLELLISKAKTEKKGSILFIHGVSHDAQCWSNYLEYFSGAGFDCHAVSLRGHGKSEGRQHLNSWGLSDYVTDVVKVILSMDEKPIIVGHSMGGAIAQKVVGEHQSLIKAAVLLAPAVKGGLTLRWKVRRFRHTLLKAYQFIKMTKNPTSSLNDIKGSLFMNNRLSPEALTKIAPHIQAESNRASNDLSNEYTPYYGNTHIPVMVIGSEADLIFPTEDLVKTANAYEVTPIIMKEMCHDMMIDPDWQDSADEIKQFLKQHLLPLRYEQAM
jgi:alpha-beta hydrolase superfamily lysophospholipase